MTTQAAQDLAAAKRATLTIAAAAAIVGAAAPVSISLGGLAGHYLLGADKTLATLPVTGFNLGVALGALPAALLMRAVGRRNGFMSGALVTATGGAVAAVALMQGLFWLFGLALALIGIGGAFVQQYRFAVADAAPPVFKPKAISWVLGGGVFAAIIGPQAVIHTKDLLAPVEFAGAFVSVIGLGLVGVIVLATLKIRDHVAAGPAAVSAAPPRPLGQIVTQPRFAVAFLCAVTSYALMSFLMTGAPLAMVGCGFSAEQATLGISWHVMAMFAPSFVTGHLIARFGKETIVATGLVILIACALVALSGIALWQFWLALILLGVGWNFGFIGATAMLTETYTPAEKNTVQGAHDFALFGTVALASLMSGATLNAFGWATLNWILLPIAGLCLVVLIGFVVHDRRAGAEPPAAAPHG
ncbi:MULTISPECIES: MFS transporter [unclassified Roseitalea]|uniref:MFS transporter n=1 Tax=unclassified Roseitalea TaxID=2639107 RepID=UPI00273D150D|nr:MULTISPECIES: MFS transporter [unclassified Roseitalea]